MLKIAQIIPIARGVFKERLSYFTAQTVEPGMIVAANVRGKEINALVESVEDAEHLKTELKKSDFSLKKLGKIKNRTFFLPIFLAAVKDTAEYFACSSGQILKDLTPRAVIYEANNFKSRENALPLHPEENLAFEGQAVQEPDSERYAYYKSLIRESFARRQSVFWLLPTVADVEMTYEFIKRGIEQYVIAFHGQLPKKNLLANWKKALITSHPILIIGTPQFLSLPRTDFEILIVDKENSMSYKKKERPFTDFRRFAEFYATTKKIRLIFGDTILRSETIYRVGRGEIAPASPLKYRLYTEVKQKLADINKPTENAEPALSLGADLTWLIDNALSQNEKTLVFSGRRGLAPVTICSDCGKLVSCDVCGRPLVIHNKRLSRKENRIFICHRCGQMVEISDTCEECGSWRLAVLGYGTEKIEEEINERWPQAAIFRIDSDSCKSTRAIQEAVDKFYLAPRGILIGTELALPRLKTRVDNIAVAGIDPFFALPDYRINEKLFTLLARLRSLADKKFLIQTRNPNEKIFEYLWNGNLLEFFREELAERKELGYPPFKTMIKISLTGKPDAAKKEIENLAKRLADIGKQLSPLIFPTIAGRNGQSEYNILLRLSEKFWPDKKLFAILLSLPPSYIINVDPETIL